MTNIATDASSMTLAYVISAYRLPGQLIRLVEQLDEPSTYFVISVDRGTDQATFDTIRGALAQRRNIHILPRHSSAYRGFGHVRSTLRGIEYLLNTGIGFDYLSVLTGQDLPIKTNEKIRERLASANGHGFMEHFTLPDPRWSGGGLNRFSSVFLHTHRGNWSIGRRRFFGLIPKGFPFEQTPYGGSGYWTLSHDHVAYINEFVRRNPKFVRFFRTTDMPDETFFHTIIMNSPFAGDIVSDDLRHIDWSDRSELPRIMRMTDLATLAHTEDLFARKFDVEVDADVYSAVINELLHKT